MVALWIGGSIKIRSWVPLGPFRATISYFLSPPPLLLPYSSRLLPKRFSNFSKIKRIFKFLFFSPIKKHFTEDIWHRLDNLLYIYFYILQILVIFSFNLLFFLKFGVGFLNNQGSWISGGSIKICQNFLYTFA